MDGDTGINEKIFSLFLGILLIASSSFIAINTNDITSKDENINAYNEMELAESLFPGNLSVLSSEDANGGGVIIKDTTNEKSVPQASQELSTRAPQDPYPIFGYVYQYNGALGVYSPIILSGATVEVTWLNPDNGTWVTLTTASIVTGQYCVNLFNYSEGGIVFVNVTNNPVYGSLGYNYTLVEIFASPGGRRLDVVCGVPYTLAITSYPALVNLSIPFNVEYEIQDIDGLIAPGYFTPNPPGPVPDGNMNYFSSDPLFVNDASHPLQYNGLASPTPGFHTSTLRLGTAGFQWVNISEGGAFESNPYLTPWGTFFRQDGGTTPGYEKDWDNFTIQVASPPMLIAMKLAPVTAISGESIMYTIFLTNNGAGNVENITVVEIYSPWTTFIDSTPPPDVGNNTWTPLSLGGSVPVLAPLETFVIFINISIDLSAPGNTIVLNNITVNYTDSNGFYMPEIYTGATTLIVSPLLSLSKTAPPITHPGFIISYTITYRNIGTSMAYNVWVNETYPPGVIFVNSSVPPTVSNNAWFIGNLAPGGIGIITINMLVNLTLANGTILDNMAICIYTSLNSGLDPWKFAMANASTLVTPYTGVSNASAIGNIFLNTTGIMIYDYDLRDAVTNNSMLNNQIEVNHEYYFYVAIIAIPSVASINRVSIKAWHDMGSEGTIYGDGVPNTEFAMQYNWFNSNFSLTSTYTMADPEVLNVRGVRNVLNMTHVEFYFYFTPGEQIRHASGDGLWNNATTLWDTNAAYNDIFSWNFNINVITNNSFTRNAYDEFGVCRYTRISAGDISARGLPGQVVAFPEMELNYSSNDDYRMGVYLNRTLINIWPFFSSNTTIGAANLSVSGGLLPPTNFAGTGGSNTLYFYPSWAAPDWGTYRSLKVKFWVNIPLNVLGGVYQGELIYIVEQI